MRRGVTQSGELDKFMTESFPLNFFVCTPSESGFNMGKVFHDLFESVITSGGSNSFRNGYLNLF